MSSAFGFLIKFLVLIVVLVAGAAGYSLMTGNDMPMLGMSVVEAFGPKEEPKVDPNEIPDTHVWVPLAERNISAYTQVARDDVYNRETLKPKLWALPKKTVEEQGILTDLTGEILGMVLKRNKAQGYVFRKDDFMPKGTRPGVAAGIPPGKRGFTVDVSTIHGMVGLKMGDRFDLIATIAVDEKTSGGGTSFKGAYGPQMDMIARLENISKQASVKVVVQNGVIVTGVRARATPTSSNSLMNGTQSSSVVVQEVTLAIDPEEVSKLSEALTVGASITCVPRSGHPDDPMDSETPELKPQSPFGGILGDDENADGSSKRLMIVETVIGEERQFVPVPTGRTSENP